MISEVVAKWNEKSDQKLWFFKYLPLMSMPDSILWASALFLVQFNKPEVIETGCVKGIYVAFPITLTIFRHLLKYKSSQGPFDESFLNKFGGVIFSQWCHLLVIFKWIKMTLFVSFMFHFFCPLELGWVLFAECSLCKFFRNLKVSLIQFFKK